MTVAALAQQSNAPAVVELFELDCTSVGEGIFYFTNQTNRLGTPVIFNGVTYAPLPVKGSGWTKSLNGAAPRPTIAVDNTSKLLQAAVIAAGDLVGCRLTRTRIFETYIDAVNFPGGENATADPTMILTKDVYLIDSKLSHNNKQLSYELCWAMDIPGRKLPSWLVLRDFGFPGAGLNR
jgi:lambda family phage minor tail protein L